MMGSKFNLRWFWLAALVLLADQATKYAIEKAPVFRVVVPGMINLVHTHNRGVAFGLFGDAHSAWVSWLLILFSAAVMVLLVWLLAGRHIPGIGGQAGVALILGGAAGNVMDRVLRQSVVDFLDLHWRNYHWPAFNVADSAIVCGAGLVIVSLLMERRHPAARKA
jgi:signal peptidase II